MPVNDALGQRMKEFYEAVPKTKLMRRTPVAIRIDGKAFHTFTHGFVKPYDEVLRKAMEITMRYLCENIQGCVLGYTQSDEITLILVDYKRLNSCAWFDNEVQKMCSVAASMATMAFNRIFPVAALEWFEHSPMDVKSARQFEVYQARAGIAMFDARAFNIPREEVTNLLYWRQLDAIRNSIQLAGQSYFSHKELQNKSCDQIREMLWFEKNINWHNYPAAFKNGSCAIKVTDEQNRSSWEIDREIPIFKGEGREYVEKLIQPEE